MFVLSIATILNIIKINESIIMDNCYETYGTYSVIIREASVVDKIDKLKSDANIKSVYAINYQGYEYGDKYYNIYNGGEEILTYKGIELIEGTYPKNESEIAVERSYLYEMGIESNDMLGSKISIPDENGDKKSEYLVTAIVKFSSAIVGENTEVSVITNKSDKKNNSVYFELKSIENYVNKLNGIAEKYEIDRNKCYINFDLFAVLGALEGEIDVERNTNAYYFIFLIILICSLIAVYNIMKIFINDMYNDIAIINLLGVSKEIIAVSMLLFVGLLMILGILAGTGISFACAFPIINLFVSKKISYGYMIENMRFDLFGVSICVYFAVIMLLVVPIIINIYRLSAGELKKRGFSSYKGKIKKQKNLFSMKKNFFVGKFAIKNILLYKLNSIINIFAIALSVSVFVVGLYFVKINIQSFGYYPNYDYKIIYNYTIDEEKPCEFYNELCRMKEVEVYPEYVRYMEVKLPLECISDSLEKYLSQNINTDIGFDELYNTDKNVNVTLMGYNQKQIDKLCEVNDLEKVVLANDEMIILSKTIPLRGDIGFEVCAKTGMKVTIDGNKNEQKREFTVKKIVDELSVYPNSGVNTICVIINEEIFKTITEMKYPEIFYIDVMEGYEKSIENKLVGNDFYELSKPEEEDKNLKEVSEVLTRMIIFFFVIIVITIIIALFCSMYNRVNLSINDYISYKSIGISNGKISKILGLEIGILFVLNMIIAFVGSYGFTYLLQDIILGDIGNYLYKFPVNLFLISESITLIIMIACTVPMFVKVYKIKVVEYLKDVS